MPGQPRGVDEEVNEDDRKDILKGPPVSDETTEGVTDSQVPLDGDGDYHVDRAIVGNVTQMIQASHKVCRILHLRCFTQRL